MSEIQHYTLWDGRKLADLPRPSRLEVVSWQMNVTVYPPSGTIRVTSAITEPVDHLKIHVAKFEVPSWVPGADVVHDQCRDTLRALGYITGLSKGI